MYRHSTYTECARCKRSVSIDQAELDLDARYVCTPCNAKNRVEAALVRWRAEPARNENLPILMLLFVPLLFVFLAL